MNFVIAELLIAHSSCSAPQQQEIWWVNHLEFNNFEFPSSTNHVHESDGRRVWNCPGTGGQRLSATFASIVPDNNKAILRRGGWAATRRKRKYTEILRTCPLLFFPPRMLGLSYQSQSGQAIFFRSLIFVYSSHFTVNNMRTFLWYKEQGQAGVFLLWTFGCGILFPVDHPRIATRVRRQCRHSRVPEDAIIINFFFFFYLYPKPPRPWGISTIDYILYM